MGLLQPRSCDDDDHHHHDDDDDNYQSMFKQKLFVFLGMVFRWPPNVQEDVGLLLLCSIRNGLILPRIAEPTYSNNPAANHTTFRRERLLNAFENTWPHWRKHDEKCPLVKLQTGHDFFPQCPNVNLAMLQNAWAQKIKRLEYVGHVLFRSV